MFEFQFSTLLLVFLLGWIAGLISLMAYNRWRTGTGSPRKIQKEYDNYQTRVEEHFEETSLKFKELTKQHQDLYQHLSNGATSLCRTETAANKMISSQATASNDSPKSRKEETTQVKKPEKQKATTMSKKADKAEPKIKPQTSRPVQHLHADKAASSKNLKPKDTTQPAVQPSAPVKKAEEKQVPTFTTSIDESVQSPAKSDIEKKPTESTQAEGETAESAAKKD